MPNWKKLIVSGSNAVLNSVTASFTGSLTGALIGTASWATNALTASAGGSNTQIQFNSASRFLGDLSFTFNYQSQSLQQGFNVAASGLYSHAEGYFTIASGSYSHAEGTSTQAIGVYSHAEGQGAQAIGESSHAEGYATQAIGAWSHAEGDSTQAIGEISHAEGAVTQAIGYASHAEGLFTIASGSYQHVQGQYNISSSAESAFIIGNGTADNARSNLVFASGSQFQITGSLQVSGSITGSLFGTASWARNALTASTVDTTRATDNKSYFLTFVDSNNSTTTNELVYTQANLTYNPSTLALSASFLGNLTGTASWATNALTASHLLGGASGTPGGSNKTIQFNGAGAFSGSNNFTFDSSSNQVQLTGSLIVSGNINTADRAIIGPEGQEALNYATRRLIDSNGNRSVRWEDRWLINGSGTTVTDWENNQLTISDGASSYISMVDWNSSVLNIRDTTAGAPFASLTTVDWGQYILYSSDNSTPQAPLTSVDWQNRLAYDSTGTTLSIGWDARQLFDQNGNTALDYPDTGSSNGVRLYGTASFALTASYMENTPKAGSGSAASFGGTPRTASITFFQKFPNNNYAVTITGEDARNWSIQSKTQFGFTINSNSSVALTGPAYWIATPFAS